MLDTVVMSGDDFCCSVVFGTLVSVVHSVLDTVVISGEDVCCSVGWHSGWCVCV